MITPHKRLFPPQQCTYSTSDCNSEDGCGCNQFSAPFNVPITIMTVKIKVMDWREESLANIRIMKHIVQNMIDGGELYQIGDVVVV